MYAHFLLLSYFFLTLSIYSAIQPVLHLQMVTQCAMLEEYGIFLVLADKVHKRVFCDWCATENYPRLSWPITLKHLCPHLLEQQALHRYPKNSVEAMISTSLPLATWMGEHCSFI